MKYVMLYQPADDFRSLAPLHIAAHRAQLAKFHTEGTLLMAGNFSDPIDGTALGIFTTREAAEAFIAEDPFVLNGVVSQWQIREWNEVLA